MDPISGARGVDPGSFGIGRLFDLVPDAVIIGDARTGRILLWNAGAADVFGYPAEEAVGSRLERLVPDDLVDAHRAGLARYAASAAGGAGGSGASSGRLVDSGSAPELPARRRDGSTIWVELKLCSLPPTDDQPGALPVLAVARDVTERRVVRDELVRQTEQLRAVNESLREFVAMAAHDISSPAGSLKTAAELLQRPDLPVEQQRSLIELIGRQASRVTRLGHELGEVAAIERGTMPVTPRPCALAPAVATLLVGDLAAAGVTVSIDPDLSVEVDPGHLSRILTNLLANATRYGRPPIHVWAAPGAAGGPAVDVHVTDAGDGVAEAFEPRLFAKLARGTPASDGFGLGLAISRGLARLNAGDLTHARRDTAGADFVLTLPAG